MRKTKQMQSMLSALLVFVLVFTLMPMSAMAAESPVVLIAGGDYQQAGDHSNSSANISNILTKVKAAGITAVDGFLFVGDYDCETHDSSSETAAGITSLMNTMTAAYSNLNMDNTILVQGNHDYADSRIDKSAGYTFDGYSVFVMNEDDYPNYGGSESQAQTLSAKLDTFLAQKLEEGYTKPIFVTSHVPLHFGPRTNKQGDGKYGKYYFDVLNAYGAEGLNIIFMHGHNHAYGYDEYLGGEAIFLPVGDKINIARNGSQSSYDTYTLNFTYMNAGYTGYYNESGYSTSSGTDYLTMTTFQIYDDRVVVGRYSEDGIYNLKSAGQLKGDYISSVSVSAATSVYNSTQTITLNKPAERITLTDAATGITVTGLKVEGAFEEDADLVVSSAQVSALEDTSRYAAYKAYDMSFTCSGTAKVTMPVPASYTEKTTRIYQVSGSTLTEVDAEIETVSAKTTATFTVTQDGTYAVVNEKVVLPAEYYERVESVSDLVSGEQYLIIFDCSSQTTADAIVMPTIATYSSGSSKRMGPDVLVSDGIADEDIITGDYDNYLWTLTKSGSGWLIGNGSQNIDVSYSSTSSRCELSFTSSGEALTIASASSNPSDADSCAFAIYDSSNYYWQYNTTATLIYGTTSDSYTSRFIFYKVADGDSTATGPDASEGWQPLPSGGSYVLDTDGIDIGEDHKYIVVGSSQNYALTLDGSTIGAAAVTVDGNTATVEDPALCEFYFVNNNSKESGSYLLTQDGTNSVYHSGGNMYYGTDNKGYWHIGSGSNGAYQLYDYDNLNWYLNYGYVWASEATNRFAVSSNARTLRFYKSQNSISGDVYARLAGETEQVYNTADAATEATVLEKLCVELTTDGTQVTDTVAVTSDMIVWETAFNGTVAGTYRGTVVYGEEPLDTVTVTINAEHNFETVTVDATCTEAGSITTTCTICGESTVEVIEAKGHDYTSVVTEATCGQDGSTVYTCTVCNDTYTETIPATGKHTYASEVTEATCGQEGKTVYTCEVCEDTYTEIIPATGKHTYETVTVDATCTEAGSVTTTCSVCGDSIVEVIEAKGHDYTSEVTDATCGQDGSKVYTCHCGDTYTETISATGNHSYETVTVDATCTENGSVTDTCTVCGHSQVEVIAAAGHQYTGTVTAATCTEQGYTTYNCSVCGHSYTDSYTEAFGHTYDSTVTATCTEDGFVVYTCETCGDSYNGEEVEAFGHSYTSTVVAPTCATSGYTTYVCTTCGHTYTGDEVEALGHDYTASVTEPTCTEGGYTTYTCATCGHSYIGDQVDALGHDYESVVTDPTFEEEGYTTHTCMVCGDVKVDSFVPVLSHTYETVTEDATCTEDGAVIHTCVDCGYSYTEVLPALGHSYETVTTDPTCETNGSVVSTCVTCGNVETEVIPATGHSYETVKIEPTCTETGYITYTCACGDVITEEIPALGHSYETVTTDPTCTEAGSIVHTCACGDVLTEVIPALGHSYGSVSVAPTCTEAGYTTYTCATCGHSYVADEIAALGHSYEAAVTAPTCTEDGYTTYTCTVCGHSYTGNTVAALGHSNETVVTAPTCTEGGYTTYTCSVCGYSYTGDATAALGHSYTSVESDGYLVYTCHCGDSYSEKIETVTYTKVSSLSSNNAYVITLVSGNKYYALSHENNTISVEQVTVSNGVITSEITEDLVWNYSGSKLSYEDNGKTYYLYAQSASGWWNWFATPTLTVSSSNSSSISFSSNKLKVGSYYLRYSSSKVSLNRSSSTTYLFQEG